MTLAHDKVATAVAAIKAGKMVIMVDEEDRENEGDLVLAAEHVSPEAINFMVKEARGLVCLTLEPEYVERLQLPMMGDASKHAPDQGTAFTVSIEARRGVTTGISAADRSHTIKVAIDESASPEDIVVPGHIFPLRAKPGGVLDRAGHTEGSVDLAKLAGLKGAGVICEIMNDDGTMARLPDLVKFSELHDIPIVSIADLIEYRLHQEPLVKEVRRGLCRTRYGTFTSVLFENLVTGDEHVALVSGGLPFGTDQVVDVRVHNQRPLIDVLAGSDHEAGYRLDYGLQMLARSETAVFVYLLQQDGAPSTVFEDLSLLDPEAADHIPTPAVRMDHKMVGTGAQILRRLGVARMRIHTTSHRNLIGLSSYGLQVMDVCEIPQPGKGCE